MSEKRGIRPYPPIYFFVSGLLMVGLHHFLPITRWLHSDWRRAGIILIVAGFIQAIFIKRMFDKAGTTIRPFEESSVLLTSGPFRFSRNPVYVAMVLALIGLAVTLGTASPILVIPVFAWIIQTKFILGEESMMRESFGQAFDDYTKRVRRWI